MTFSVRVIPRARRSEVAGRRGDALLVRLAAPPVDDAANEALVELLAATFGRRRRDVSIVAGHRSRDKRVNVSGLSDEEMSARLAGILDATG